MVYIRLSLLESFSPVHRTVELLPRSEGHQAILTFMSQPAEWPVTIPLLNEDNETVARELVGQRISHYDAPTTPSMDRGTRFQSTTSKDFNHLLGHHSGRTFLLPAEGFLVSIPE
ncbi:hypothetical protein AHF37_06352 [Paragonimus kellicotti]|nr:hypothetical protein AHF37_06352 [Paragonimus kellicotti]